MSIGRFAAAHVFLSTAVGGAGLVGRVFLELRLRAPPLAGLERRWLRVPGFERHHHSYVNL